MSSRPLPDAETLRDMLRAARVRTLSLVGDLHGDRLLGPKLAIVNPPLWEVGHVGWFQEYWCLRRRGESVAPSRLANADALYDSSFVQHERRWELPLPGLEATLAYLEQTFGEVIERVGRAGADERLVYFAQLAAFHEEMHCEAMTWSRQTLGYPAARATAPPRQALHEVGGLSGDTELRGGMFPLGAAPADGFVFDNEKWSHPVHLPPFRMARAPVTNAEFAAFVDAGGYRREELWSVDGWRWRSGARAGHPVYWRREGGRWYQRTGEQWDPLPQHRPAMHVNWYEADAYCRWAQRRLPTEAEWEYAATTSAGTDGSKRRYPWGDAAPGELQANLYGSGDGVAEVAAFPDGDSGWGCRQMLGNIWEWTADWFAPYPGFVRDPYREYSEPWFGNHKVLRGGSFATRGSLLRGTWRNFFTPERRDIFAGFRTCA